MIPKDSYSNLYLGIYQVEIKKEGGRSDSSRYMADRPPVRGGPSAQVGGAWGGTGCPYANNGPSVPGCRTVRAPRGLSAGVSRTVRACRMLVGPGSRDVSQAGSPFLLKPD
jgi:hypothetical protein